MNKDTTAISAWWNFFKRQAREQGVNLKIDGKVIDPIDKAVSIFKKKTDSERLSKKEYKRIYMAAWNLRRRTIIRAEKEFREKIQELKLKNKKVKKNV